MPAPRPLKLPKLPARSHGMGTIRYIEARACYLAELVVGKTPKGNPKRDGKTFALRDYPSPAKALQEAETWLNERILEKRRGTLVEPSQMTLEAWLGQYLKTPGWKPKYRHDLETTLNRFALPGLGRFRLQELTPSHVKAWADGLQATPYLRFKALHYLKLALNRAVDMELIHRNPARKVKVPKPQTSPQEVWEPEETVRVLAYLAQHNPEMHRYVHIALTTGMRREELLGLTWRRVNFQEGWLEVREVLVWFGGRWSHDAAPKTPGSQRRVYLDPETVEVFRAQLAHVENMRALARQEAAAPSLGKGRKAGSRWTEMDLCFPSREGTPYRDNRLAANFRDFCAAASVTHIPPKNLRNTASSYTDTTGLVPIHVAAQRAGHSKQVREKHYQARMESQQRAAALPLAVLLGRAEESPVATDGADSANQMRTEQEKPPALEEQG